MIYYGIQYTLGTCTLELAKQEVCMSVSCIYMYIHTFLKYRDHYTYNIIVAAPMQHYIKT